METGAGKRISHKEKAYRYVKKEIISRSLLPGDMICERSIAGMLGVSRTPVREALQSLRDDGWLTIVPRKGTVVRDLKKVDIEEVLQLRLLIGANCVEYAAVSAGPADIAYFESLIERQKDAARRLDPQTFMALDMEMHLGFVRFAGNRRMFIFAENLCDYFQYMGMQLLAICEDSFQEAVREHEELVAAIAGGDASKARALLIEHILGFRATLLRYIEERENGVNGRDPERSP